MRLVIKAVINVAFAVVASISLTLLSPALSNAQQVSVVFGPPLAKTQPSGPWILRGGSAVDGGAIFDNGEFAIAQGDPTIVEIFDKHGTRLLMLPTAGDRFRPISRVSIAPLRESSIVVSDPRTATLGVYKLEPKASRLVFQIPTERALSDLCSQEDEVMVFSQVGGGRIDRLGGSGDLSPFVASVGESRPMIQQALNDARLLCLPDVQQTLVVGTLVPRISLFDKSGRVRWASTLPEFRVVDVITSNPRSITYQASVGGYDRVLRVVRLSADIAAIQTITAGLPPRSWGDPGMVQTRFVDLRSGVQIGLSQSVPEILAARAGRALLVDYVNRKITLNSYSLIRGAP